MAPSTIVVLAVPGDPRTHRLPAPPPGVQFALIDSPAELDDAGRQAEGILAYWISRRRLAAALEVCPRVRWVHSIAAGVDHLVYPELADRGIVLTNSRGVFSGSLAEFALAGMLYFAKDFPRMRRAQQAHAWDPFEVQMLAGRTLGVVGYGDIGRAAARLARAVGMNVLALRRRPEPVPDDPAAAVVLASKRELFERSDYVLLAAPLTPETHHMVARAELEAMKPSAVFMNVGRGALVDEPELIAALTAGRIRGAVLDVFETEPLLKQSPLFDLPNVLVSPHCADRTATWLDEAVQCFLANLARFERGEPLANLVDVRLGY